MNLLLSNTYKPLKSPIMAMTRIIDTTRMARASLPKRRRRNSTGLTGSCAETWEIGSLNPKPQTLNPKP